MNEMNLPKNLKYTKDYSWVKIDGEIAIVGIVGPAAKKVQEFVFIKLPEKGKKLKAGETYVSVEAVKWSGHLSSPVSGEIIEVNDSLFDEPSKINHEPYKNWIMKINIEDKKEIDNLLDSKGAEKVYGGKIE